jgi:hypothetical protein
LAATISLYKAKLVNPVACTTLERGRRRETWGETVVVEAMEGEGAQAFFQNRQQPLL